MTIDNPNIQEIVRLINGGESQPSYKVEYITYFNQGVVSFREIGENEELFATESTVTGEGWQILTCNVVEIISPQGATRFPVEIGW